MDDDDQKGAYAACVLVAVLGIIILLFIQLRV